eukprot:CAMPEP_0172326750 /NCGR_PEP_ID=MMETSP1058-20130122/57479_1 /TAXON_ID=83371 /ORGANISM="Detonula confervacea, Strain CCMP 353" /LENGTH=148 /DNA_ID=CAMNT_0013043611 /DNA_START=8 /DNA_END=451 /DNA_ORIENTATION=-
MMLHSTQSHSLLFALSILTAPFSISVISTHSIFINAFPLPTHLDASSTSSSFSLPPRIRLRSGFPDEELAISLMMAKELMNPLGISHRNNLMVAEDTLTGRRVGWAQIRSLGYAGIVSTADTARFEDGNDVDNNSMSRRDVQSTRCIE